MKAVVPKQRKMAEWIKGSMILSAKEVDHHSETVRKVKRPKKNKTDNESRERKLEDF